MIEFAEWGYLGLFVASFLAATVVPFSSEVVFSAMVFGGLHAWTCVLVATAGNWLGGMTSFYIGRLGKIEWVEKFLHIKKEKIEKSRELFCAPFRQRKRHNGKGSGNLEKTACIDDGRRRDGGASGLHEGRAR